MKKICSNPSIGIYEKALPALADWSARLDAAAKAGYDFFELAIDEDPERIARLSWTDGERRDLLRAVQDSGVLLRTLILSAHRSYPLGSGSADIRRRALEIFGQSVDLAVALGARQIQLAGYFVYHEPHTPRSRDLFLDGLRGCVRMAGRAGVMLGLETMDGEDVISIEDALEIVDEVGSPWLQVYPDVGNLAANGRDVAAELRLARGRLIGIHLKDSRPGEFRRVAFGEGCVPFVEAFRALREIGYDGSFLIEMWNDDAPDSFETIVEARRWILERMAEANFIDGE